MEAEEGCSEELFLYANISGHLRWWHCIQGINIEVLKADSPSRQRMPGLPLGDRLVRRRRTCIAWCHFLMLAFAYWATYGKHHSSPALAFSRWKDLLLLLANPSQSSGYLYVSLPHIQNKGALWVGVPCIHGHGISLNCSLSLDNESIDIWPLSLIHGDMLQNSDPFKRIFSKTILSHWNLASFLWTHCEPDPEGRWAYRLLGNT